MFPRYLRPSGARVPRICRRESMNYAPRTLRTPRGIGHSSVPRRIARLIVTVAALLALGGCSRTGVLPYHSTASVPHFSRAVGTAMTLMRTGERRDRDRTYGVAAAVDDGAMRYVLLVPGKAVGRAVSDLHEANVWHAAPLTPEKADELANGIADALRTWDASLADGDGRFYEFEYAPEQEVRAVSEHVEVWRPSVRFHYSHTSKGPAALLAFGDDTVLYQYEMKRREEVEDLMTLLRAAVQRSGG